MARHSKGFYETIEYIGPRPQKPKKNKPFGGWIIVVIAIGIAVWFSRPFLSYVMAANEGGGQETALERIAALETSSNPSDQLAVSALRYYYDHIGQQVSFDSTNYAIDYPGGDIPADKCTPADVVVRSLRGIGIDLQEQVHEDMQQHYRSYPQIYDQYAPDTNIDHRRIANLQRFFERKGEVLSTARESKDYHPGDIVIWQLNSGEKHIGIIVPSPNSVANDACVIHFDKAKGVKWEDILFNFDIVGHFRYPKQ